MVGISSFGGYVPRYRLNRMIVFGSMGWLNPVIITNARGEKAVANFDEDSITMGVAAGMDCLKGVDRSSIDAVYFATTTAPFKERLNANLVAGALGARDEIRSADFGGSLKAGTSALLAALEFSAANDGARAVVCAADNRLGKMASTQEMVFGDAGASIMVGGDEIIAEYKGSFSLSHDFVDHLRGANTKYDRMWEERWIRDIGYSTFIPEAVKGLCEKYGVDPAGFDKVVYPCYYGGARKKINGMFGEGDKVQDDMQATVGDSGAAHPLLMLAAALETAQPGQKIMVVSYGSGCDAMWFEVTDNISKVQDGRGVSRWLARRADLDNYQKYLVWRDMAPPDLGIRGETDKETRWSLIWRDHKALLGMWGGKCKACGTQQFPPRRVCANPDCGAIDQLEPVYLADKGGKVFSYTADMLAASLSPPAIYGMISFNGGGRTALDFVDCTVEDLAVGQPLDFTFRRKFYDPKRDIPNYFWKAIPAVEEVK